MRKIKFRVWDNIEGIMLYSEGHPRPSWDQYDEDVILYVPDPLLCVDGYRIILSSDYKYDNVEALRDAVIMQYTGLTDKNGEEICEGDIVKFTVWWDKSTNIREVVWNEEFAHFDPFYHDPEDRWTVKGGDVEVIGNKFENPELLDKLS